MVLPQLGTRIRLTRDVDRYPNCLVMQGKTGTVVVADPHIIYVYMDERVDGLDGTEWNNCLQWTDPDGGLDDFWADVEPIDPASLVLCRQLSRLIPSDEGLDGVAPMQAFYHLAHEARKIVKAQPPSPFRPTTIAPASEADFFHWPKRD